MVVGRCGGQLAKGWLARAGLSTSLAGNLIQPVKVGRVQADGDGRILMGITAT